MDQAGQQVDIQGHKSRKYSRKPLTHWFFFILSYFGGWASGTIIHQLKWAWPSLHRPRSSSRQFVSVERLLCVFSPHTVNRMCSIYMFSLRDWKSVASVGVEQSNMYIVVTGNNNSEHYLLVTVTRTSLHQVIQMSTSRLGLLLIIFTCSRTSIHKMCSILKVLLACFSNVYLWKITHSLESVSSEIVFIFFFYSGNNCSQSCTQATFDWSE